MSGPQALREVWPHPEPPARPTSSSSRAPRRPARPTVGQLILRPPRQPPQCSLAHTAAAGSVIFSGQDTGKAACQIAHNGVATADCFWVAGVQLLLFYSEVSQVPLASGSSWIGADAVARAHSMTWRALCTSPDVSYQWWGISNILAQSRLLPRGLHL